MQVIAAGTSKIINVFTSSFLAMLVVISVEQIPTEQKLLWLLLASAAAAVPFAIYFYEYKKGAPSSFWSPALQDRFHAHLAWVTAAFLFSAVVYFWRGPELILALGLVFFAVGLVNLILAGSFKISVHSESITILVFTLILAVSSSFAAAALLIILVGWSRVYLKAHTLSEVSLGVLAAVVVTLSIFGFFGLATF